MRFLLIFFLVTVLLSLSIREVVSQDADDAVCDEDDHVCLANAGQNIELEDEVIEEPVVVDASNVPKGANREGKPREAVKECIDRYPEQCPRYAAQGECENNPG